MKHTGQVQNRVRQQGFSLLETLIAASLMVLLLVPALQSLATFSHVSTELEKHSIRIRLVDEKMDEVLTLGFSSLANETGSHTASNDNLSDPTDTIVRRLVYVSFYDGDISGESIDPFIDVQKDADLIWIAVVIEGTQEQLTTLVRRP